MHTNQPQTYSAPPPKREGRFMGVVDTDGEHRDVHATKTPEGGWKIDEISADGLNQMLAVLDEEENAKLHGGG